MILQPLAPPRRRRHHRRCRRYCCHRHCRCCRRLTKATMARRPEKTIGF